MGIQINGNTNNINAGIGSLSIEDINELDIVGVATAANFKTGVSNLHSVGLTLSGGQIDVGSNIKIGTAGVATASNFKTGSSNLHSTGLTVGNNFLHTTGINVGTGATIHVPASNTLTFGTNSNERLRIESNGDVEWNNVGTPTPGEGNNTVGMGFEPRNGTIFLSRGDNALIISNRNNDGRHIHFNQGGTGKFAIGLQNSGADLAFFSGAGNSPTERLRINSSGNLGLGESSSIDARLHVNSGTDNAALFLESTDGDVNLCMADNAGSCRLLQAGGNLRFRTGGNANAFGTGDSEKMVLDGNGRLLLGTTTEGLATYGENLTIGSVGNGGMTIRTGTGNKGTVYFSDGTSGTAEHKGSLQYDHSDDSLRLAAGGSVRLRVESTGEVRMLPSTSGNTNTQFSFNNVASTPFISVKSNNLSEAVELKFEEDNGGANIVFRNKNTSGQLYTNLEIKNKGSIFTTEDGSVKSYPIIMGTDTQHDAHEGQFNFHDFRAPTAQIGGWVFLGHDYGPAPYPVRRFKIAVPENSQGTRVYQVWHDGDANYDYGGLYEIRINQWANSARFESVSIRCINGNRSDLRVVAYNDTKGIMIQTSTIWGNVYIRKAGWDDGQRKRGSSYCAVENNGALAIYNGSGTDDGTMPSGGTDVYCFDGAGGSHTGGRDIESSNNFNG